MVVIGRNEGDRLLESLASVRGQAPLVYVDSGSSDGSAARARGHADAVLELSPDRPFSAARARNEGHAFLRARQPTIEFVQFVDGDTRLAPGWLERAAEVLHGDPTIAAVAGRLEEEDAGASRYARLLRMEWAGEVGDTDACGGIAMYRCEAFERVAGFRPDLPAGEEPELCGRLRRAGHRIVRIDAPMGAHRGDIASFGVWWRRSVRAGEAAWECLRRGGPRWAAEDLRRVVSALLWGGVLPVAIVAGAVLLREAGSPAGSLTVVLAGVALFALQWLRIRRSRLNRGDPGRDATLYATYCLLAKPAEGIGILRAQARRAARVLPMGRGSERGAVRRGETPLS